MKKNNTLALIALASGGMLFANTARAADAGTAQPGAAQKPAVTAAADKCHEPNACKGKSECKSAKNKTCAGHNACKGQGWVTKKTADCQAPKKS